MQHKTLSEEEHQRIYDEEYKRAVRKEYYEHHRRKLMEAKDDRDPIMNEVIKQREEKQNSCKSTHVHMTVNPREGTQLDDLVYAVTKAMSKKWLTEKIERDMVLFTFEQRGRTEKDIGQGIHCHVVFPRNGKQPCKIRREMQNTFKHLGNMEDPHCLSFKWKVGEVAVKRAYDYIKGEKNPKNKDKQDMMVVDKVWRRKMNMVQYYDQYDRCAKLDEDMEEKRYSDVD